MEFSNSTTNQGILQRCEKYCGFQYGDITGNDDLKDEFTGYANDALDEIWYIIFDNYAGWQFDDSNHTDLPIATQNLQNSTHKYALPTKAVTIKDIEIKNESDEWRQLHPLTAEQISQIDAEDEFRESDGEPEYYKVVGDTIELFPAPDYTQTDGLKVYFDRGMVDFSSGDTSQEPGFAKHFHDAVPTMASLQWRKINTAGDRTTEELRADEQRYKQKIGDFYSDRWEDNKPTNIMVGDVTQSNR